MSSRHLRLSGAFKKLERGASGAWSFGDVIVHHPQGPAGVLDNHSDKRGYREDDLTGVEQSGQRSQVLCGGQAEDVRDDER
jgi:hypothetical protein